jgi:hypothetical protein
MGPVNVLRNIFFNMSKTSTLSTYNEGPANVLIDIYTFANHQHIENIMMFLVKY